MQSEIGNPQSVDRQSALGNLQSVLSTYWGYSTFRPLQHEAMDAILSGRDSVVVLPTGGGKSLCFQAPALVRRDSGPGLVVFEYNLLPTVTIRKISNGGVGTFNFTGTNGIAPTALTTTAAGTAVSMLP